MAISETGARLPLAFVTITLVEDSSWLIARRAFLEPLLIKVAQFAEHAVDDFRQVGINEDRPGAGIGWHRDKPEFGDVVGVSLISTVKMRFRKTQWPRLEQGIANP